MLSPLDFVHLCVLNCWLCGLNATGPANVSEEGKKTRGVGKKGSRKREGVSRIEEEFSDRDMEGGCSAGVIGVRVFLRNSYHEQ